MGRRLPSRSSRPNAYHARVTWACRFRGVAPKVDFALPPPMQGEVGGRGSIIAITATDAPLLPHQLRRIAQRIGLGIGRTGGTADNGSGDIFLAFSSANRGAAGREGMKGVTTAAGSAPRRTQEIRTPDRTVVSRHHPEDHQRVASMGTKRSVFVGLALMAVSNLSFVALAAFFGSVAMVGTNAGARLSVLISGATQLAFYCGGDTDCRRLHVPGPPGRRGAYRGRRTAFGLLSGVVGVGGGFLVVPALVLALPMRQAVGTSLGIIATNCAVGFYRYPGDAVIDWRAVALVAGNLAISSACPIDSNRPSEIGDSLGGSASCMLWDDDSLRRAPGT